MLTLSYEERKRKIIAHLAPLPFPASQQLNSLLDDIIIRTIGVASLSTRRSSGRERS